MGGLPRLRLYRVGVPMSKYTDEDRTRDAMIDGIRLAAVAGHMLGARLEDMHRLLEAAWVMHKQIAELDRGEFRPPRSRHLRIVR